MKKILLAILALVAVNLNAQVKDSFESNKFGWTETSAKDGEAVIKDGKMHIVGKKGNNAAMNLLFGIRTEPSFIETHCFPGYDVTKDFEIKCEASVKKITGENVLGIMLDYVDDGNFIAFLVEEDKASLIRVKECRTIGSITNNLKIKDKKKTTLDLSVKSSFNKLEFFVNGMKAVESRYVKLTSTGLGFYVFGQHTVDFDNLEIIQ